MTTSPGRERSDSLHVLGASLSRMLAQVRIVPHPPPRACYLSVRFRWQGVVASRLPLLAVDLTGRSDVMKALAIVARYVLAWRETCQSRFFSRKLAVGLQARETAGKGLQGLRVWVSFVPHIASSLASQKPAARASRARCTFRLRAIELGNSPWVSIATDLGAQNWLALSSLVAAACSCEVHRSALKVMPG